MAMTYATVTGRLVVPGTSIGVRARVTAKPVPHPALVFPAENRITWGPSSTTTDPSGELAPPLMLPLNSEDAGVRWQITAIPLDSGVGRGPWAMGTFDVTTDVDLSDLVEV